MTTAGNGEQLHLAVCYFLVVEYRAHQSRSFSVPRIQQVEDGVFCLHQQNSVGWAGFLPLVIGADAGDTESRLASHAHQEGQNHTNQFEYVGSTQ